MSILNEDELEGVLAHELGHVNNRDILISTIAATIAGAVSYMAYAARWAAMFSGGSNDNRGGNPIALLFVAILAPIAAFIIQSAISRTREFKADATGARICGKPLSLASALQKLQTMAVRRPMQANPSTAHMFIVNPLSAKGLMNFFSTHPPLSSRIARLRGHRPTDGGQVGTGGRKMHSEAEELWKRLSR